jgi:hypothetical protein
VSPLLDLLQEFHRDKLDILLKHEAGARLISQYDFNNAYQYIVNRDEMHLSWLAGAIAGLGGAVDEQRAAAERHAPGKGAAVARGILEDDAREAQAFVDRWRPRVEQMTNARQRGMLRVILGEALEQKRSFEQALAGRTDLLGRRAEQASPSEGEVLPTRWIE